MENKYLSKLVSSRSFAAFVCVLLVACSVLFFQNQKNQGVNWTYPYFSGAANHESLFDWKISVSDYDMVKELSVYEYRDYKHRKTEDVIENNVNNYGYVLVAIVATKMLPWFGDIQSVIILQTAVHILCCLVLVLFFFRGAFQRYAFILLYAANPVVIYFVTFPFYYFWMFIPSFFLVMIMARVDLVGKYISLMTLLLVLSFIVRPTTLFLIIYSYCYAYICMADRGKKVLVLGNALIFVFSAVLFLSSSTSSPWHTAYVGIGAYPNEAGIEELADYEGYDFYKSVTGIDISTHAINGNYGVLEEREKYLSILKDRYFDIFMESPLVLIRNGILNFFQIYSVGHVAGGGWVNLVMSLIGAFVMLFFVYAKQYVLLAAIGLSAIGFVFYFPPIPAYNYSAYLLLVSGVIFGVEQLRKK